MFLKIDDKRFPYMDNTRKFIEDSQCSRIPPFSAPKVIDGFGYDNIIYTSLCKKILYILRSSCVLFNERTLGNNYENAPQRLNLSFIHLYIHRSSTLSKCRNTKSSFIIAQLKEMSEDYNQSLHNQDHNDFTIWEEI